MGQSEMSGFQKTKLLPLRFNLRLERRGVVSFFFNLETSLSKKTLLDGGLPSMRLSHAVGALVLC
jgi:hypothetical protein